jgi:hypothetical protein
MNTAQYYRNWFGLMVAEADISRRSATLSFNVHFVEESLRSGWETAKEVLYNLSFLVCPIMDEWSLTTFCISLLFVERVLGSCLELEPILLQIHAMELKETPDRHLVVDSTPLISPLIAVVVALALLLSCAANSSSNSLLLTPHWLRLLSSQHTMVIIYTLLGLFCLESLLVASILLLASHALVFPEAATAVNNLFLLVGVWLGSLIGSHFLRRYLYRSLES